MTNDAARSGRRNDARRASLRSSVRSSGALPSTRVMADDFDGFGGFGLGPAPSPRDLRRSHPQTAADARIAPRPQVSSNAVSAADSLSTLPAEEAESGAAMPLSEAALRAHNAATEQLEGVQQAAAGMAECNDSAQFSAAGPGAAPANDSDSAVANDHGTSSSTSPAPLQAVTRASSTTLQTTLSQRAPLQSGALRSNASAVPLLASMHSAGENISPNRSSASTVANTAGGASAPRVASKYRSKNHRRASLDVQRGGVATGAATISDASNLQASSTDAPGSRASLDSVHSPRAAGTAPVASSIAPVATPCALGSTPLDAVDGVSTPRGGAARALVATGVSPLATTSSSNALVDTIDGVLTPRRSAAARTPRGASGGLPDVPEEAASGDATGADAFMRTSAGTPTKPTPQRAGQERAGVTSSGDACTAAAVRGSGSLPGVPEDSLSGESAADENGASELVTTYYMHMPSPAKRAAAAKAAAASAQRADGASAANAEAAAGSGSGSIGNSAEQQMVTPCNTQHGATQRQPGVRAAIDAGGNSRLVRGPPQRIGSSGGSSWQHNLAVGATVMASVCATVVVKVLQGQTLAASGRSRITGSNQGRANGAVGYSENRGSHGTKRSVTASPLEGGRGHAAIFEGRL